MSAGYTSASSWLKYSLIRALTSCSTSDGVVAIVVSKNATDSDYEFEMNVPDARADSKA